MTASFEREYGSELKAMKAKSTSCQTGRRGILLVLSSPSGAGKSTIARNLLKKKELGLSLSVSMTTRQRRSSEVNGIDYHFISLKEFQRQREDGFFLECAEVHDHFYGTPVVPVENALNQGKDMVFDIDWQGAEQIRQKMSSDIVSVFILPPSMQELKKRLQRRSENADSDIAMRLKNAASEILHWKNYDYVLVNQDLDKACADVQSVLFAERLRSHRLLGVEDFVSKLLIKRGMSVS